MKTLVQPLYTPRFDGKRITCPACRGTGAVAQFPYDPAAGPGWEFGVCPACRGDGVVLLAYARRLAAGTGNLDALTRIHRALEVWYAKQCR